MTTVFESSDPGTFEIAKSLLRANGIEFIASNEQLQDLVGGGRLGGVSVMVGPARLAVPESEVERARELLASRTTGDEA